MKKLSWLKQDEIKNLKELLFNQCSTVRIHKILDLAIAFKNEKMISVQSYKRDLDSIKII
ncbi:hypothetical protein Cyrtocomes_01128 [Candidatus Cyrtobacter comes]|uniref:Uncharacterized protein n=1 Tax=Candidatus Cyrtobacter comes TaxID=675776 RepID=A0ABU5L9D1_9RICK|nr:hypothetical protein [Candidatus Cyrtobacter comes]